MRRGARHPNETGHASARRRRPRARPFPRRDNYLGGAKRKALHPNTRRFPACPTGFAVERDSLGEVHVPADALYGAQTQRALENFPISGQRFGRRFIQALGLIKKSAARVNRELGYLDGHTARAIAEAAAEVARGDRDGEFVLDVYQTGSGTSSNMNANEVIAALANRILEGSGEARTHPAGRVHPNDHVNFGQSSNDVIPTAIHVSARTAIEEELIPALEHLRALLAAKAEAFDGVLKSGRTHLMDATPVRLGQEFGGYAMQLTRAIERLWHASAELAELALGGTATGTGINTHPDFARLTIEHLSRETGLAFREAERPLRGAGLAGRLRERLRSPERRGIRPDEDRRRYPLALIGPDFGHSRDPAPRRAAGELHHARQGEPGHVGGG